MKEEEQLSAELLMSFAENTNTPPEVLALLAQDEHEDVRRTVAFNLNTPVEVLTVLANDEGWSVRSAVGFNLNTPVEVLTVLANDEGWSVRAGVASNPNTPVEILTKLAEVEGFEGFEVRKGLASNPSTPLPILLRLASDPNGQVADNARETILSRLQWSDADKAIVLGLLDETQGKESGSYFPSLEALQEAVEAYKKIGATENFDPNNGEGLTAAFVWAEPVKRD